MKNIPLRKIAVLGLIASTFSATATNHSAGQEKSTAPGTRQVVEQAFASIENVLAQCKSVDFQSTHQVTETEIFRQIYSKYARSMKMTGGRTSELHFVARDDKYWYSSVITEFDGSSNYDEERAFDGKNYQLLYRKLGTLGFSRFNPEGNHLDIGSLNPLEMFGFLLPQVQGSMPCIAWSAVKNARMWGNCLAAAQYVEVTVYNGRACMTVKIPCVLDNWIAKGPCYYIVYFSIRDGYFPAGWKLFSAGGRLLVDYQIDELGAANADKDGKAVFRYPKKATYRCYASDPQYPADKPQYVITTETKSFALNTVEDDSIFTIDPVKVKAGMLFDYDRNIATRLPAQP